MNIVVLDGFTLNPGDLSWDQLKSLGACQIFDRTPPAEMLRRAAQAEIVLTNKAVLAAEHIRQLPQLKYIGVTATGTNIVDLAAARARGIPVTNVPAYGTRSVAQTTIALLLELTQHVGHHAQTVRASQWARSVDWCYWERPLIELDGLTLGIVGFGRIGQAVAELAAAFGMNVLVYNPSSKAAPPFVRFVELETLFRQSDVLSLHCPLTPQTQNLINAERLSWMKPTAFLLNTGRTAGAPLDALPVDPPPANNPLLTAKNCIITPHLAWATRAARSSLLSVAVGNLRAFLSGKPLNVVN